jgi:hypothetical protein
VWRSQPPADQARRRPTPPFHDTRRRGPGAGFDHVVPRGEKVLFIQTLAEAEHRHGHEQRRDGRREADQPDCHLLDDNPVWLIIRSYI